MIKKIKILQALSLITLMFSLACQDQGSPSSGTGQTGEGKAQSLESINQQLLKDTSDANLYYQRARIYIQEKNADAAYRDINRALILKPQDARLFVALSDIYLMQGRLSSCKESLEKAVKLDPRNNEAFLKLAELSLILQEYDQTFEYLKKAIEIDKLNPTAYFISGYAFLELKDTVRAIENLLIAVNQDQNYYDAYIILGNLYAAKKQELAVDYYNNALNINPQSIEAYYNTALYYQESGQIDQAIETYEKLLRIKPDYQYALYNLGYINLVFNKDFQEAIRYFTRAIETDQEYFEAYYNRGFAHELLGNINEARWDYQRVLEIEINYPKAIEGLNRLDEVQFPSSGER